MLDRLLDVLLSGVYKKAPSDTEYYKCNDAFCPLGVALDLIDPTRWVRMSTSKGYWYDAGCYLETFLDQHGISPTVQRVLRQLHRKNKSFVDMVAAIRGTDMNQHVAEKFAEYLESGRYPQQTGWSQALCQGGAYSILGVMSELAKDEGLVVSELQNAGETGQYFDVNSKSWITFSREVKAYKPASSSRTDDAELFLLSQTIKNWSGWNGFVPRPEMSFKDFAQEIRRKYIKPAPETWQLLIAASVIGLPLLVSAYLLAF